MINAQSARVSASAIGDCLRKLVNDAQALGTFTKSLTPSGRPLQTREPWRDISSFDGLVRDLNRHDARSKHAALNRTLRQAMAGKPDPQAIARLNIQHQHLQDRLAQLGGGHA